VQADLLWSDATTGKIDAGNLLHDLLRQIKYVGDEDAVIRKLKADAWLSAEQTEEVAQQLKAIVYHPELAKYFQPEVKVFNERSLIRQDSKTRIPDRIIVSDNQAVILDYKTGKEKDSYRQQLNDYAQWLSEAGFVVEKKLIYYTALNKLEEVI
jgi:ATP-dependent exoDNAse (exonuclease V) beta subunit